MRFKQRISLFVGTTLLLVGETCLGGWGTIDGTEQGLWTDEQLVVVVARFTAYRRNDGPQAPGWDEAALVPLATLAGTFDPSNTTELPVRFFEGVASSIRTVPKEGAVVLAVIRMNFRNGEDKAPANGIVSDGCTFMPDESSLVPVNGVGDKRVVETLDRVRKARAKGVAEREKKQGTD